jgi:hypothetical protein
MALTHQEALTGKGALSAEFKARGGRPAEILSLGAGEKSIVIHTSVDKLPDQTLQDMKDIVAKAVGHAVNDDDFDISNIASIGPAQEPAQGRYKLKVAPGDIPLAYSDAKALGTGSFGARVENGTLVVPSDLRELLEPYGTGRSAGAFYGILVSSPTHFVLSLDWTSTEVETAKQELRGILRGHVTDEILDYDPSKAPQYAFGALDPKLLAKPKP